MKQQRELIFRNCNMQYKQNNSFAKKLNILRYRRLQQIATHSSSFNRLSRKQKHRSSRYKEREREGVRERELTTIK